MDVFYFLFYKILHSIFWYFIYFKKRIQFLSTKMRLLTTIGLLICVTGIFCRDLTSRALVDQLYEKETKDDMITRSFIEKLFKTFSRLKESFYKSMKSSEGYKAPNICVWKICSKPLKKKGSGKNDSISSVLNPDKETMNEIFKAVLFLRRYWTIKLIN